VIEYVRAQGEPMPGVVHAMRAVHEAGVPIGVASSSSGEMIRTVLDRLDLGNYVTCIATADDEAAGKPDPAVYLTAARKLGVVPEECVAIEDSPNGVRSAKAAGMYCIVVPDKYLANDPRMDEADLRLASMEEFSPDLLPGLSRFASR
jgi:sugar-phosphatase